MRPPLRIAMFVGTFPVVSETFIVRQIKGLIDLGHEVDIYADTRGDLNGPLHSEVAAYRLLERTTYMEMPPEAAPYELPIRPLFGRTWTPGASQPVLNSMRALRAAPSVVRCFTRHPGLTRQVLDRTEYGFQAESLSALFRLHSLTRRRTRYDVLHAHFGPIGNSFRFARELWQAPLLVSFHGYDFCTLPRQRGLDMYQRLFATADAITANSQFTRNRVAALGCPAAKIHPLPVGLDLGKFPFRERRLKAGEPVRLITVARLVEIKGHEFALRAVAKLREQCPHLVYDIVGDGPLRLPLTELAVGLGLKNIVTFHGARDGAYIEGLLANAHLAVLASVNIAGDAEGQGLFVQEAQACGLPVVVTEHGALPEGILPGQSGWAVPERDPDALAEVLRDLIQRADQWPDIGRAGRAWVQERYEIGGLTDQLDQLYRDTQAAFRKLQPI